MEEKNLEFPNAELILDIDLVDYGIEEFCEEDELCWAVYEGGERWLVVKRDGKERTRYNAANIRLIRWQRMR